MGTVTIDIGNVSVTFRYLAVLKLLAMRDQARAVYRLVPLSFLLSLSQAQQAEGDVDGVKDSGEAAFG